MYTKHPFTIVKIGQDDDSVWYPGFASACSVCKHAHKTGDEAVEIYERITYPEYICTGCWDEIVAQEEQDEQDGRIYELLSFRGTFAHDPSFDSCEKCHHAFYIGEVIIEVSADGGKFVHICKSCFD